MLKRLDCAAPRTSLAVCAAPDAAIRHAIDDGRHEANRQSIDQATRRLRLISFRACSCSRVIAMLLVGLLIHLIDVAVLSRT